MTHAKFSTNGTTWTTATFTTTVSGNFVNFENLNYYWAALTSTGQIWKNYQVTDNLGSFSISSSYPSGIKNLSSVDDVFIAVSESDYRESINLQDWSKTLLWTTTNANLPDASATYAIVYGNGLWVAASQFFLGGQEGDAQFRISTDGITWTTVNQSFAGFQPFNAAYGNGLWAVTGASVTRGIRISTNGTTWTTASVTFSGDKYHKDIVYGNGVWVAGGVLGEMHRSTNGSTWTSVTSNFGLSSISQLAYGNGVFVAIGDSGSSGIIRTSTNGSAWTTVTSNFGATRARAVAYGNGVFAAGAADGQVRRSTDGYTWTTVNAISFPLSSYHLSYGNGRWFVLGFSGQSYVVSTSTNLVNWTTVETNQRSPQKMAYGNGQWFTVGGSNTFSRSTLEQANLNKFIKSEDEQKRAFLNDNGILFDWNGFGYERISTGINDNFVNGAIRNNGGIYEYVIQGNNAMYRSTNLTTWTTISRPLASGINDIIAK